MIRNRPASRIRSIASAETCRFGFGLLGLLADQRADFGRARDQIVDARSWRRGSDADDRHRHTSDTRAQTRIDDTRARVGSQCGARQAAPRKRASTFNPA